MADDKRKSLGRGLSALLGEDEPIETAGSDAQRAFRTVPIGSIQPGRFQPRHRMADGPLQELADSIREKGVLQPIVVRQRADDPDSYELIAGERRWRAAQLAQIHDIPVVVKSLSDGEALEVALIENLQRQDLSPVEEADGYRRLMDEFGHTQQDLAKVIGKSRSNVANTLRLLALPEAVKRLLDEGALSAGHARALLTVREPERLADIVIKRGLNVRQTEQLANDEKDHNGEGQRKTRPAAPRKDSDTLALERDISNLLGLSVEIRFGPGGGTLTLHYDSLEQLDDILHRLSQGEHGSRSAKTDDSGETPL